MKKVNQSIAILMVLFFSAQYLFAQSPNLMSYQAVVRNSSFGLVVSSPVGMRISIIQGSATGTQVYQETQLPTTNANGLASIQIGAGTVVSGNISTVNWGAGPYFIKTEIDPAGGSTYNITNTTQLMSVPYALYASNSGTSAGNCTECHIHKYNGLSSGSTYAGSMAQKRDDAASGYPYSQHASGSTNISEGPNASCAACHSDQGFQYRVSTKLQPTFTGTGPYTFAFSVDAASSSASSSIPGHVGCFTCHKGNPSDSMNFVSTDSVRLLLYSQPGKERYSDLPQGFRKNSNLCVMCHNARPITQNTTSGDGSSVDYPALATNLSGIFYDSTKTASTGNKVSISSRTSGHYGWPGNIMDGVGSGPMEIPGSIPYTNSAHKTVASCADCHMATPAVVSGAPTGGHTFIAAGNYNGCNVTACHGTSGVLSATAAKVTTAVNTQKANMDTLANLLKSKGIYLIMTDTTLATDGTFNNKWYKFTSKHFTGDLNIGTTAGTFVANTSTIPAGQYKFPTLTNGQFGAMLSFIAGIREYSGGIHNTQYTNALLRNSIQYLRANPIP